MSYRIKVNATQIFGNNEYPSAFLDFLRESGVKIDEDGLFNHTFEVGEFDVMKAISAIEKSIEEYAERTSLFFSLWDFRGKERRIEKYKNDPDGTEFASIFENALEIYNNGYIFIPVFFVQTLLNDGCIKPTNCFKDKIHFHCYVQTDKITVKGS